MQLVVGVVTFRNSSHDLRRFAKAYSIAKKEVSPQHSTHLAYLDNSAPSGLDLLVQSSEVTQLPSQGNVGYTRGINRLMKHAFESLGADAFITANPDGAFHHSTLKNFVGWHRKHPQALLEARQFPQEHPKIYDPVTLDTPWCSGCCIFIPKLLYQSLGPFDENFFMYMEDVDYSWRARAQGFGTKLCPDVLYGHHVIDRGKNEVSVHQHFISGRYLGWKWGHHRFFRWAEKTLLKKKGFTQETLPPLPEPSWRMPRKHRKVTCFGKIFSFSERRW